MLPVLLISWYCEEKFDVGHSWDFWVQPPAANDYVDYISLCMIQRQKSSNVIQLTSTKLCSEVERGLQ